MQDDRRLAAALWSATSIALMAGFSLALMETAQVLSQPGAASASLLDVTVLATWLGIPYAAGLAAPGLGAAGIIGLLRRLRPGRLATASGWRASMAGGAAAAAVLIWLRSVARLADATPIGQVLSLLLALVAIGCGVAVSLGIGRGEAGSLRSKAGSIAIAWLAALAALVLLSRGQTGQFGRAVAPWPFALRLVLSAGVGGLAWLAASRGAAILDRGSGGGRSPAGRWGRRAALAVSIVWVGFGGWEFSRLLSYRPVVHAEGARAAAPMLPGQGVVASTGREAGRPSERPNVLLISIDTLRADHLSCYGYPVRTSPRIDDLAASGALFQKTASTASFTLPAHASMMTGLFPTSHGATYQNRDPESFIVRGMGAGYPTMGELLREAGYETAGIVSGPLMSHQFGFARGFDLYDDRYDRLQSARGRLFARTLLFRALAAGEIFSGRDWDSQRIAAEINPLALAWLDRRAGREAQAPFFLFLHYWDPHAPYEPPPPLGLREDGSPIRVEYDMDRLLAGEYTLTARGLADTLALYDAEIQYVDRHVGEIIDSLASRGLLDRTLVILTSDHGESFGEHDHWEHSRVLYEDLLAVPFIVRPPGGLPGGRVVRDAIAQPSDILPTVLAVAGVPAPRGIEGRDLSWALQAVDMEPPVPPQSAPLAHPGFAFAELDRNVDWPRRWAGRYDRDLSSVRSLRWKLLRSSTGDEELYDLPADPGETRNLVRTEAGVAASLRALSDAWRRSLRGPGAAPEGEIDEGLKENLRGLGYIQ